MRACSKSIFYTHEAIRVPLGLDQMKKAGKLTQLEKLAKEYDTYFRSFDNSEGLYPIKTIVMDVDQREQKKKHGKWKTCAESGKILINGISGPEYKILNGNSDNGKIKGKLEMDNSIYTGG